MSSLPRLSHCPGSGALPQASLESKWSEDGTGNHKIVETAIKSGDLDKLPVEIRSLIPKGAIICAEHAIAYDYEADTARDLGVGINREYEVRPTEIPGTIDLDILVNGSRLTVADWKLWTHVGAPDENEQIMCYGLAAARLYNVSEVTLVVGYLENDEDTVRLVRPLETRVVDAVDLDGFAAKVRRIVANVEEQRAKEVPDVRESRQACSHCPAKKHCPAKTALVRQLLSPSASKHVDLKADMDPPRIGLLYDRLKLMQSGINSALSEIYGIAANVDIPLPNGNVLRRPYKPVTRRNITDADVVHSVLTERHGQSVADAAMGRKTSQDRIRSAVKGAAGVRSADKEVDAVLLLAEKKGGVTRTTDDSVRECPPEKLLKAGNE